MGDRDELVDPAVVALIVVVSEVLALPPLVPHLGRIVPIQPHILEILDEAIFKLDSFIVERRLLFKINYFEVINSCLNLVQGNIWLFFERSNLERISILWVSETHALLRTMKALVSAGMLVPELLVLTSL